MCNCKKNKEIKMEANPATPQNPGSPVRTGACPFCTRKHLLRARGYAREVAEDPTREWERDNLLENLLLAEDHALALEDAELASGIRDVRHAAEEGASVAERASSLYDRFKAKYFPGLDSKTTSEAPIGGGGEF